MKKYRSPFAKILEAEDLEIDSDVENDKMMIEYLEHFKIPYVILLTKADKLNQSEVMKQVNYFSKVIPGVKIITTSSEKGTGKDDVLRTIESFL